MAASHPGSALQGQRWLLVTGYGPELFVHLINTIVFNDAAQQTEVL